MPGMASRPTWCGIVDPENRVASRQTGYGDNSFRKIADQIRARYEGAERTRGKATLAADAGTAGSG